MYNAKLLISFTSQLKGRIYLFLTYSQQFLDDHLSHHLLFVHLLHSQHRHNVVHFMSGPNRPL